MLTCPVPGYGSAKSSVLRLYNEQTVSLVGQFTRQIQPKQLISQFVSRIKFQGSCKGGGWEGRRGSRWAAHNVLRDQCVGTSVPGNFAGSCGLRLGRPRHADQRIRGAAALGQVSRGGLINTPNLTTDFPFFLHHLLSVRANLLNGSRVYLEALSSRRHSIHFLKPIPGCLGNKFALHLTHTHKKNVFFLHVLTMSLCLKVCEPEQKSTWRAPKVAEPLDLALIQIKHFEDHAIKCFFCHQKPFSFFTLATYRFCWMGKFQAANGHRITWS